MQHIVRVHMKQPHSFSLENVHRFLGTMKGETPTLLPAVDSTPPPSASSSAAAMINQNSPLTQEMLSAAAFKLHTVLECPDIIRRIIEQDSAAEYDRLLQTLKHAERMSPADHDVAKQLMGEERKRRQLEAVSERFKMIDFDEASDEPSHPPIIDWTYRDARGHLLAATLGIPDRSCYVRSRVITNVPIERGHADLIIAAFRTLQALHDRGFALLDRPVAHDDFVCWKDDQPVEQREFAFEPRSVSDVLWRTNGGKAAVLCQSLDDGDGYSWDVNASVYCTATQKTEEEIRAWFQADVARLTSYFAPMSAGVSNMRTADDALSALLSVTAPPSWLRVRARALEWCCWAAPSIAQPTAAVAPNGSQQLTAAMAAAFLQATSAIDQQPTPKGVSWLTQLHSLMDEVEPDGIFDALNELGRRILWQWLENNTELPNVEELFIDVYAAKSQGDVIFATGCVLAGADSRRDDVNETLETATRLLRNFKSDDLSLSDEEYFLPTSLAASLFEGSEPDWEVRKSVMRLTWKCFIAWIANARTSEDGKKADSLADHHVRMDAVRGVVLIPGTSLVQFQKNIVPISESKTHTTSPSAVQLVNCSENDKRRIQKQVLKEYTNRFLEVAKTLPNGVQQQIEIFFRSETVSDPGWKSRFEAASEKYLLSVAEAQLMCSRIEGSTICIADVASAVVDVHLEGRDKIELKSTGFWAKGLAGHGNLLLTTALHCLVCRLSGSERGFPVHDPTQTERCDREQAHYALSQFDKIPSVDVTSQFNTLIHFKRQGRVLDIAFVQGINVANDVSALAMSAASEDPQSVIALGYYTDKNKIRREMRAVIGFPLSSLGQVCSLVDPPHHWALPARHGQSGGPIINPVDSTVVGIISGSNTSSPANIVERSVLMRWLSEPDKWVEETQRIPNMKEKSEKTLSILCYSDPSSLPCVF